MSRPASSGIVGFKAAAIVQMAARLIPSCQAWDSQGFELAPFKDPGDETKRTIEYF
jgi:hypothetical protein